MYFKDIFKIIQDVWDSKKCLKYVENIYQSDRWFDFEHFEETANYCAQSMKNIGLDEVEMIPLRADGITSYGDWVVPRAWKAVSASLVITSGEKKGTVLADYDKVPCSLMMYSAPTPLEGLEGELIVADNISKAEIDNVEGKFLLTGETPSDITASAQKHNAAGIISDYVPLFRGVRQKDDVQDLVRWENNLVFPLNDKGLRGFNLSPSTGKFLRGLIQNEQTVYVKANIDTEFFEGECYTVSGKIPGSGCHNEEVMISGHLYEPGANDNASGCGMILSLADVLKKGIIKGLIPKPKRTVRFVMGFECSGLMGYSHFFPDRLNKTVGLLNTDMTGAANIENAKLHLWHNPLSNYSYMDILLPALVDEYINDSGDEFEYEEDDYSIVDNLLADPTLNVPTVSMIMHPSVSYHSSLDNMERVDSLVLKRNGVIAGAFIYFLAYPCNRNKEWLCRIINHYVEQTAEKLFDGSDVKRKVLSEIIEKAVSRFALEFNDNCDNCIDLQPVNNFFKNPTVELDKECLIKTTDEQLIKEVINITPTRVVKGPLTFLTLDENIRDEIPWKPFYNYQLNCSLYWTDGKKNLLDIYIRTSFELGFPPNAENLENLLEYYKFLCKHGYIHISNFR